MTSPLVEEATRRAGLVWLRTDDGGPDQPVWHVWHEGAAYVVTGGLEQPVRLPLERAVVVVAGGRDAERIVQWEAAVTVVPLGTPDWQRVVPLLHAARLNARDGEQQPDRWARESTVLRLAPTGRLEPVGDGAREAPPVPVLR